MTLNWTRTRLVSQSHSQAVSLPDCVRQDGERAIRKGGESEMPHRKAKIPAISFFAFILLVSSRNALGYIDPGTGSLMIQLAIAFLVGALFTIKGFWRRILAFLKTFIAKKKKDGDSGL